MIDCISREDCVGCKACGDICPRNAITYEVDREGFWYPVINKEICIDCSLCDKACPVQIKSEVINTNRIEPDVYAVYHKDMDIRYSSTSGGLFHAMADSFLRDDGVIVGCVYADDYRSAFHTIAYDSVGLKKMMRSKYFQSDTKGIYTKTAEILKSGKKVLFSGAPCQIAALYNFLGSRPDNLYTVDFICLGINSPFVYNKFIEELEKKYKSPISEVNFKDKKQGWTSLGTCVKFKNGKVYLKNRYNDPWIYAYIIGKLFIRNSCANCKFKSLPRVSDVSFGDFWGPTFNEEDTYYGVSLAMINNAKGDFLLQSCANELNIEKRTLDEAIKGNPAIFQTAQIGNERAVFFDYLNSMSYSKAVWKALDKEWPKWWIDYQRQKFRVFKRKCKKNIKSIIKK